ncbi:MAG: hypothetical protein A2275_05460 [Bacteroidetes bacterium RIFOXYA12_FULL_35_11]|nr:MAG: hypothetical protein A2X01_10670 [Bacteroidetes bacterium GWF2_35_48]OFY73836.1 MAG: hypothetical protein A2275_05460 [Bacteroidetes bacterium RIFOXYA12_FULL_35_11]OFY93104.1 MAG: hypothetical protein A2309_13425 [Bacteroidetes bacterium RIFOXYB2_FULL_35_7]HBX49887.1 hypothetical protein [Bacteroidales bacterium]
MQNEAKNLIYKKNIVLKLFMILTFIGFVNKLFSQSFYINDSLREKAFSFRGVVRMDEFSNFTGGLDQGSGYLGEVDISLKIITEKLGIWKGGEFFVQGMNVHGKKPTSNIIGDFQTFSNIESDDHTSFYEFWYNQHLFNEKVAILVGQLDMNADFSVSENASHFINSSFGVIPTLSMNNTLSIFPLLTCGAVAKAKVSKKIFVQTGFYNGYNGDFTTNPSAIKWEYKKENGFYNITEVHYFNMKDTVVTGTYKLGLFYHTGYFIKLSNGDTLHNNYGIYAIADQIIFSKYPDSEQGLNAFFETSYFPEDRNFLNFFIGGGLRYRGLFNKRKYDDIGLAFATGTMSKYYKNQSDSILSHETAIEFMYKAQLHKNIVIQPEIQYIINPGAYKPVNNSFVGMIRLFIKFEE